jgi:hypothetical protein
MADNDLLKPGKRDPRKKKNERKSARHSNASIDFLVQGR